MSASSAAWSFPSCDSSGPCVQAPGVRAKGRTNSSLMEASHLLRSFKRGFGSRVAAAGPSSPVGRLLGFRDLNTPCSHYVECLKASSFHLGLRPLGDEVSPLRSSVCKATLHETAEQSRVTRCDAPRLGGSCQGLPAPGTAVGLLT